PHITAPPVAPCSKSGKDAATLLRLLTTGVVIKPCLSHRISTSESTTCPETCFLLKPERWPSNTCLSLVGGVGIRRSDSKRNWSGVSKTGISGSGSTTRKDCTPVCCSMCITKGQKDMTNRYYQTSNKRENVSNVGQKSGCIKRQTEGWMYQTSNRNSALF